MNPFNSANTTKDGGTQVTQLKETEQHVQSFPSDTLQFRVVSAFRSDDFNTTNELIKAAWCISKWDSDQAISLLEKVEHFHEGIIRDETDAKFHEALLQVLREDMQSLQRDILSHSSTNSQHLPSSKNDYSLLSAAWWMRSVMGFWEELAANLVSTYLRISWASKNSQVCTFDNIEEGGDQSEAPLYDRISRAVRKKIADTLENTEEDEVGVQVAPWFPGMSYGWGVHTNWKRGYSDPMASAVALWVRHATWFENTTLAINKEFWVLTTDPRASDRAKLIHEMSYRMTQEMVGTRWNGGFLNANTLNEVFIAAEIQALVGPVLDPDACTRIAKEVHSDLIAVTTHDHLHIAHLEWNGCVPTDDFYQLLQNTDGVEIMRITGRNDHGKAHMVSIENGQAREALEAWMQWLESSAKESLISRLADISWEEVTEFKNTPSPLRSSLKNSHAIVSIVGDPIPNEVGINSKSASVLAEAWVNVVMQSKTATPYSVSYVVTSQDLKKAQIALHDAFN